MSSFLSSSAGYDYLLKFLIIGDSGVGKSSLLMRYVDHAFCESYISTIGVDFKIKTLVVNNKTVKLQIWDTAGQERFRTITTSYYRGAHGVILVYDVTNSESFFNIKKWVNEIERYTGSDQCHKLLIGNKSDLKVERCLHSEHGKELADKYKFTFIETSARTSQNVDKAFALIIAEIVASLGHPPKSNLDKATLPPTISAVSLLSDMEPKPTKSKCCSF
jgi:Ras-related protein Rab-1A